ncbi:MAG TPA: ABC transporter substrate-binding protein [Stellaceae bacterium]|nr:ABC transporter substrate-binding protein [Stellaceae bacterium]
MRRRFVLISVIAMAFGLFSAAQPSHAAMDPRAFIGNLGDQGIQTLGTATPSAQRVARFRELFQADFDVNGIGRFAIGRYWRAFTPAQQQEFLQLFRDYTVQAYAEKLGQYGGSRFQVTGSEQAPSGDGVIVNSQVIRPNGSPVQIDWHLAAEGGAYKVEDVYVDRVSMKVTQRDEFAKIIQNNGGQPSALLAVLRQELRKPGGGTPTPVR